MTRPTLKISALQQYELRSYLRERNIWQDLKKLPKYRWPYLTNGQIRELLDRVEGELSPENLSCDGELPAKQVEARARRLMAVKADLQLLLDKPLKPARMPQP